VLGVLAVTVLPEIFGAKDVKVPNIQDKELDKALAMIVDKGLDIGETIEKEDEEIEEGHVIKTDPEVGELVKEGTKIDVYYSIGKKKVDVLNYLDRNYNDIKTLRSYCGSYHLYIFEPPGAHRAFPHHT